MMLNALVLVAVVVLLLIVVRKTSRDEAALFTRLELFEKTQERTERAIREETAKNRDEMGRAAREQRQELNEQMEGLRSEQLTATKQLREEINSTLNGNAEAITRTIGEIAHIQKSQLEGMSSVIGKLAESNDKKLEEIRITLERKLDNILTDNTRQLEQMRQTVDEKLQGTLEKRLGESFRQVSEQLEQVHKGLGEMQTLAAGVGDLKKVLTNVKTRGTWGEVQLGSMLEQVLSPDQFALNVSTKEGRERVEFAIKLPGQGANKDQPLWLPIDAKFPIEDYQRLLEAQERGDVDAAERAGRQLETRVKNSAREISEKYLNPPKTTDFAILFLPIEGLFAEVVRRSGLLDAIQRDYRVTIAGPTTLWSILNSLQMGFRTLAIQERSNEVWNLLAAVKTEWTRYGSLLDAVQNRLNQATKEIERVKSSSRAIGKKLDEIQELPAGEAARISSVDVSGESGDSFQSNDLNKKAEGLEKDP